MDQPEPVVEVVDTQRYTVTVTLFKVRNAIDLIYQLTKVFTQLNTLGDRINLKSMSEHEGSLSMSRLGLFRTGSIEVKKRED